MVFKQIVWLLISLNAFSQHVLVAIRCTPDLGLVWVAGYSNRQGVVQLYYGSSHSKISKGMF